MSSYTVHCIGQGPDKNGERQIYRAMNRLGIQQEVHKARKEGKEILRWYAQTGTGKRILTVPVKWDIFINTEDIPKVKTVICPICEGDGYNGRDHTGIKFLCMVCQGSGITKPGNEKHWRPWQLKEMRADRKKVRNYD